MKTLITLIFIFQIQEIIAKDVFEKNDNLLAVLDLNNLNSSLQNGIFFKINQNTGLNNSK